MNRFFTLLFAASCLTAVGQVPDYVPTEGLVAWYPFNGDAYDESGNGNDGDAVNVEPAFDRFGNENAAFYFSGSGCTPRVDIDMNTTEIVDAITISIWFNRQGNGCNGPRLFEAKPPTGDQGLGHMIIAWDNGWAHPQQWNHNLNASSGTSYDVFLPADSMADVANNTWSMLVYRNDGLTASYFQNGVLIATMSNPENSTIHLPPDIAIGRMNHPAYDAFNGLIDDIGFWSRALSDQEILALYNTEVSVPGCTESAACNYAPEANVDDGSCELFTCKCLEGTIWSEELGGCVVANPSDSNFDGCVQLNDLLDLLSAYGDCGAEESPWQCGDPLEYQGYEYETVQIGEQCWFAENLRAENYRNGESIVYSGSASDWETNGYTAQGCRAAYNDDPMLGAFWGYIYNGFAVNDERALCPTGWIVPKNADWLELGEFLGGMNVAGQKMKNSPNDEFAWNGDNSSGFGGYATGDRHWPDGSFNHALDGSVGDSEVVIGLYWSGAPGSIPAQNYYALYEMDDELTQSSSNGPPLGFGAAVRCIKDAE